MNYVYKRTWHFTKISKNAENVQKHRNAVFNTKRRQRKDIFVPNVLVVIDFYGRNKFGRPATPKPIV